MLLNLLKCQEKFIEPEEEEGMFTKCSEVLDDWFNSCNVQGVAQMETVEVEELLEEMKRIENE